MPASPFQQGYRPVLPDSATPSASLTNYGQNPSPSATTHNSFGSVSSLPPKYSQLYENPGLHHRPQVTMPNGQGQQSVASMQQWSHGVPNQIMSANTTSSQALISRLLGHTSSRTQGTREAEIAPVLRLQQEAGVLPNEVSTSRDAGKELATSSTRTQPSEAIQRILNMNPSRMVTRNFPSISEQGGSIPTERVPYVPPRRGRPPKRRDPIESYQRGKLKKFQKVYNVLVGLFCVVNKGFYRWNNRYLSESAKASRWCRHQRPKRCTPQPPLCSKVHSDPLKPFSLSLFLTILARVELSQLETAEETKKIHDSQMLGTSKTRCTTWNSRGKVNPLTPISDYSNHRQGIDVAHHPERSVKYKKFSRV
ncbi:unnamed protein product [Sphenostylis stenocarpa]|uniref:Uncharacterized protein n=1 Tax=Sphenostylis stenocarpa TaxID=92480 RepID=A0AA86SWI4_9FABA|nr:unnamed protein product [Sphenostylis stenocarpa]